MYDVYIMKAIYDLAGSFIAIFTPIYLLQKDLNVSNVFVYYIVFSICIPIFFFFSKSVVGMVGLRNTSLFSYPFLFLNFFLLYNMERYGVPVYFIAMVSAMQSSLYWFPLNIWVTNTASSDNIGSDLSKFFVISNIVRLFAPIISAIILVHFGFKNLFVISAVFYFISAIPLFYLPEFHYKEKLNLDTFRKLLKKYPNYFIAEIFVNLKEDAEGKIWPLFIYLSFRDFLSIGYVGTISVVGGILFTLLVGKYTDKVDKRKLISLGAIILSFVWLARFFATSQVLVYVLTLAATFFEPLVLIPIRSIVYSTAKREGAPTFILFREFANAIGRIALYIFAFIFITSIKYLFVFLAVILFGLSFISRKRLEI